jgi:hypothetical protein
MPEAGPLIPRDRVGEADAAASSVRANSVVLRRSKTASHFVNKQLRQEWCSADADFVPWRFSAAGRRSAWMRRHPGGREPAHEETTALQ